MCEKKAKCEEKVEEWTGLMKNQDKAVFSPHTLPKLRTEAWITLHGVMKKVVLGLEVCEAGGTQVCICSQAGSG